MTVLLYRRLNTMGTDSTTHRPLAWIDGGLDDLEQQGLRRRPLSRSGPQGVRIEVDGRELINFGSNDYLALAADPRLAAAVAQAAAVEGWGSGASPLVTGHGPGHRRLEQRLAQFEGTEAAVVFSSGFAANAGTIAALVGPGDAVFADRRNHASLLDGCRLSRADVRVYPHCDWQRLDALLAKSPDYRRKLIATDGLFSIDGDLAPLEKLSEVACRHGAMLLVDEAHATGVFGRQGRGVAEHFGVEDRVDVRIGTLSKAIGSAGGFVAGSGPLIEWLINSARPYIYSTALPSAMSAAAVAALDMITDEPQRRRELLARSESFRRQLTAQGWQVGRSASQIVPLLIGDPTRAVTLSTELRAHGLLVPAIRPPTVPQGESCLRVSLTSGHTPQMLEALLVALNKGTFHSCVDVKRDP